VLVSEIELQDADAAVRISRDMVDIPGDDRWAIPPIR
jgi:hypothetical protein